MRLARYDRAGEDRLAIVEGDELIDILDAVDATGGYYSEMAEKRAWFADMTSLIAAGPADFNISQVFGFIAVTLASINIFGGFIVTQRMLQMFRKKQR